jgi:hypothetical protein
MQCTVVVVESIGKTKQISFNVLGYVPGASGPHHVMCGGQLFKLNIMKTANSQYPVIDIWELTTRLRHHDIVDREATVVSTSHTHSNVCLFLGKQRFKEVPADPTLVLEDIVDV